MDGRKSYINQSAKVSTVTSTAQNNQISFLLEGFSSANKPSRFPEVSAAVNLAQANKCEYFDSISSYDTEQIGTLLKDKTENEQKAVLLSIYLDFSSEGSSADIIETLLKKPYHKFFGEVPKWLSDLNPFTINTFAAEVLSTMFDGKTENFTIYKRSNQKELMQLSDEISARRFMAYISERPELKAIYGLIGRDHLNMLNKLGEVVAQEGDYRLVKVPVSDRVISVHLYGGIHGEMAHYELLAKRAGEDGLIVPPTPVVSEDKMTEELIKLLLRGGTFSSQVSRYKSDEEESEDRLESTFDKESKEKLSINEMTERFTHWVAGNIANRKINNKALVAWLTSGNGSKYIEDYRHFCEFAEALRKQGYDTSPPPSKIEYNAVTKFIETEKQKGFEGGMFKKQEHKVEQKPINELADRFDYWMKNYNHPQRPDTKHLINWLCEDRGGQHVKSYTKFCELAALVHQKGYATNPPPVESEYNKIMEVYSKGEKQRGYKF